MADKRPFTKEDIEALLIVSKKMLFNNLDKVGRIVWDNIQEAIDPSLRLAGRVRARYESLIEAGFSHEEAVDLTSKSIQKNMETVLNSLRKTEKKEER